ncbi:MAG: TetR family transcriptional regulator C-terminal domain-containing protein [Faecalibacterium sp.]|nr:TetR family transcriptional regulator C-terminal domain-containing protein [Ruminococcus sp.]MCM1391255.1 TetR family transcriptional regulator C-terminal domain-containing protein [Ruminococcus sp.]MCM1484771.1 TetR family transcriptional regulator C-terminal domain-containing protein [Faecalibacterium sp.]
MNKSESKYFNTAFRMDEALIALLEVKDLEYITVKEICEKAEVNRSTFYLHYETIADLVDEAMESVNQRFLSCFSDKTHNFVNRIGDGKQTDLVLITEEYLLPYLNFIRDNKHVYRASFRNPSEMQVGERYRNLKTYIIEPILKRFGMPETYWQYYIAYYIEGIMAIIKQWLNNNCRDSCEIIATIIEECVRPFNDIERNSY